MSPRPSPSLSREPMSMRKSSKYREYQAPVSPAAQRKPTETFTYAADVQGAEGKSAAGLRRTSVHAASEEGGDRTISETVGAHRPAFRLAWYAVIYRTPPTRR